MKVNKFIETDNYLRQKTINTTLNIKTQNIKIFEIIKRI